MSDVTVLGTGLMGAAVARAVARSGRSVTVWNRTLEKAAVLEADGCTVVESATDAIRSSPVVVSVVTGYPTITGLLEAAVAEGAIGDVVNLTSGTPEEARTFVAWGEGQGLRILDGAIFGYPPQIGTANIQIVYSGDRAVYDTNRGVLDAIAGMSPYLGAPPHLAKALDVSMLVLAGSTVVAAMEGIAQGMAHGLELSDLVGLFNAVLKGHAALLAAFEPSLASGDHSTIEATIRTWRGGIQTVVDAAADAGTRSRMAEAAVATLDDAIAAGWGDAGMTAIVAERLGRTPPVAG